MTIFRYKALGKDGRLHIGDLEVSSSKELKSHLIEQGFFLISYSSTSKYFQFLSTFLTRKIKPRALMDLCIHLEQFDKAGIPLKESLEELSRIQEIPKFKLILLEMMKEVDRGLLFSTALSKHPSVFDEVFVGLIAVGEKTGRLSFVLPQLIHHLKWIEEIQAQFLKAIRYPLIMAMLLVLVIVTLMTILVPELVSFIENLKGDLPFSTRCLMATSSFLSTYLFILLMGGGLGSLLMMLFFNYHVRGPYWKSRFQEALPLIGPLRRKLVIARFCHLFAVMFGGGIDILQAIQNARKALGPGGVSLALKDVELSIQEGLSLSKAFEKTAVFPPMVVRMIKIGEQTSSLHPNLLHVTDYFDVSIKRQVDHVVGLLEPLMILTIGLVIAWIVYSVFLPLYGTLSDLDY
jgi:type IV pilus assembly protein PilC